MFTHFGFKRVERGQKESLVAQVFSSVASKYDIMNDLMSFGMHRLWKRELIKLSGVSQGQQILDIAGGTGDIAALFASKLGRDGKVILTDINQDMLDVAKEKLLNQGVAGNIEYRCADAQELPFADNQFDIVSIGFGLRNVTDKDVALREMYRVLKPGGMLLVLEFSKAKSPLMQKLYDKYSFKLIPKIGKYIAGDEASYQYLVESIRMHPSQMQLQRMVLAAGFNTCRHYNMLDGIVAIHQAIKDLDSSK